MNFNYKKSRRVPGVAFKAKNGSTFYVDIAWALEIGSRKNLNDILNLEQKDMSEKLKELSLQPLMRKYYSLANRIIKNNNNKSFLTDFYYHHLSPAAVPFLLDHPRVNKIIKKIANIFALIIIYIFSIPILEDFEVFQTKNRLIKYKDIYYKSMSNKDIQSFLRKN